MAVDHPTPAPVGGASHRRILLASLVGTSVEFYDFYIYATAASLVIAPGFEFVSGFHDATKTVATVIYANSLPANVARSDT